MPTMALPWRRIRAVQQAERSVEQKEAAPPAPSRDIDRFILLLPTAGGLAFHLYGFPGHDAAAEFLNRQPPLPVGQKAFAFWAFRGEKQPRPKTGRPADEEPAEALVMVREWQPGVVRLFSFVDMEAAQQFVQQATRAGLDADQLVMFWGVPVMMEAPVPVPVSDWVEPAAPRPRVAVPLRPAPPTRSRPDESTGADERSEQVESAAPTDAVQSGSLFGRLLRDAQAWPGWDGLGPRVIKALSLNEDVYEDVAVDLHATGRAQLIVALGILATAVGATSMGISAALVHLPAAVLAWSAYAGATYSVGTLVFRGRRSPEAFRRLLQCLGLASSPMLLLALGMIPIYGPLFVLAAHIWIVLTTVVAIGPALELDRQSALVTAAIAALVLFSVAQVGPLVVA